MMPNLNGSPPQEEDGVPEDHSHEDGQEPNHNHAPGNNSKSFIYTRSITA
jgi:hypothetical protein